MGRQGEESLDIYRTERLALASLLSPSCKEVAAVSQRGKLAVSKELWMALEPREEGSVALEERQRCVAVRICQYWLYALIAIQVHAGLRGWRSRHVGGRGGLS